MLWDQVISKHSVIYIYIMYKILPHPLAADRILTPRKSIKEANSLGEC